MLFREIKENIDLSKIICEQCEDEGIGITIDPRIAQNDVLILKVDDFYNSLTIEKRPPSPDCFILVQCESGGFKLTIVELKNIDIFTVNDIVQKFKTCLDDFMTIRFADYFDFDYQKIELILVSLKESYSRDRGLRASALMSKRFVFRGKRCMFTPHNPTPTVKPCY